ncbi:SLBB domain-containing protein, partial [Rhizobium johnstonii]
ELGAVVIDPLGLIPGKVRLQFPGFLHRSSLIPGMTVQNAIEVAGGFTSRANQRMVDVTRKINGQVLTGRIKISGPIIAGDTI